MGHFLIAFLSFTSLSTNTGFGFLYFRMNNRQAYVMLYQEKELPNNSGRPLSYNTNSLIDKKRNGCY